ncbi:hypothetical protein T484DRAFT_1774213 [Baffinella frigidus]|nr:hypothetical protein T484DRAFT_1774213 [Cryptophyta sp. CCMP2293]
MGKRARADGDSAAREEETAEEEASAHRRKDRRNGAQEEGVELEVEAAVEDANGDNDWEGDEEEEEDGYGVQEQAARCVEDFFFPSDLLDSIPLDQLRTCFPAQLRHTPAVAELYSRFLAFRKSTRATVRESIHQASAS